MTRRHVSPELKVHTPSVFLFWVPLAAQWLMMASEGPFLAAIIARLGEPTYNLAAYGIAFAFAILIESPVIMLMSASTALVEDRTAYLKLRNFMHALNALSTGLLLFVLSPPVYHFLTDTLLQLPKEVASITYGALWILLPWPAAIGYRRFIHGLLIRSGRTRLVALGTLVRLGTMASTAVILYIFFELPGAWVGTSSLSVAVCIEALIARLMAAQTIRELFAFDPKRTTGKGNLGYRGIVNFYYPLALTSMIGLTVQPLLTFLMGQASEPIKSLAVFPVVYSLSFLFRSFGLSYQEAALALLGNNNERFPELAKFAMWLSLWTSIALGLVAFTPLSIVWFETVSGLSPDLAAFALIPVKILVPIPALSVLLSLERAILMKAHKTHPITVATAIEVISIALLFILFGWKMELIGVTAAFLSFLGGRLAGVLYLTRSSLKIVLKAKNKNFSAI